MRSFRIPFVLAIVGLSTAASAAPKVCLVDSTSEVIYQFAKLKPPKKPNTAVAVSGLAFTATSANSLPISGTLVRDLGTGNLYLGLTRFFQSCLVTAVLDDALTGTVSYDCNLDGANDGSYPIARGECPF
jgi:hypothetical protein